MKIFYLFILIIICSCSNDNAIDKNQNLNKNYIKSFVISKEYYSEFEYNNGFITKETTHFPDSRIQKISYEYDSKGKLLLLQLDQQKYLFTYDNQNRLIKEIKIGTNDYYTLEYLTNKIIVTNSYEFPKGKTNNIVSEVYIDNIGRITKTVQLTSTYSNQFLVKELTYDSNNNVTQLAYRANIDNDPDLIINYEYDNKKNPFYHSNKNLYKSIYYLVLSSESSIEPIVPNNIISVKTASASSTKELTYNTEDYPIKSTHKNSTTPLLTDTTYYEYY